MSNMLKKIEKNIQNLPITMSYGQLQKNIQKSNYYAVGSGSEIVFVELLYELITQMQYFQINDEDIKNEIIARVKEIHNNCKETIKHYTKEKEPTKEHRRKREFLKNEFNIYI